MGVRPVLSVHVPKAGGSTLREIYRHAFEHRFVAVYGGGGPVDPEGLRHRNPGAYFNSEAMPAGAAMVHGHFHPWRYRDRDQALKITIIRDPVETTISQFFYWRSRPISDNPFYSSIQTGGASIFDFARRPTINRLLSLSYFGGGALEEMDFVGFHDRREEDLVKVGDLLGVSIPTTVHANSTPHSAERAELLADARAIARLRDVLREDTAFYERARSRAE